MIAGRLCAICKVARSGQRYSESEDSILELLQGLILDLQMYKQDLAEEEDELKQRELRAHIDKAEDCAYWVGGWVGCVFDVCGVSIELQDGGSFVER
eukprot:2659666-Rhodomonas_salina.1